MGLAGELSYADFASLLLESVCLFGAYGSYYHHLGLQ